MSQNEFYYSIEQNTKSTMIFITAIVMEVNVQVINIAEVGYLIMPDLKSVCTKYLRFI